MSVREYNFKALYISNILATMSFASNYFDPMINAFDREPIPGRLRHLWHYLYTSNSSIPMDPPLSPLFSGLSDLILK